MAFVFAASPSHRRSSFRRRLVDWRVVGMTAVSGVMFVAMLARPL